MWTSTTGNFSISIAAPEGTTGEVQLPVNGTVSVDGSVLAQNTWEIITLAGGNHTLVVQTSK